VLNTAVSSWPALTEEEADAVRWVWLSTRVIYGTGSECREFEKAFAEFAGCNYGVGVANGMVARDLALKAFGVGSGDEVVVTRL
jgi:dTDP-4-amino-4,6-dideoxygalactose transaminase